MPPRAPAGGSGVADVTTLFSSLATTAAATVRSGTQTLSKTLQDKQVAEVMSTNAKVIQERAAQAAQVGGRLCVCVCVTVWKSSAASVRHHPRDQCNSPPDHM